MSTYINKSLLQGNTVEAVTFDELVEHGKNQPNANIVDGIPWHFTWHGLSVTHENNEHYIINTVNFKRGEVISISQDDELVVYSEESFLNKYQKL